MTDEFEPAASIDVDVAAFDAAWQRHWPGVMPAAYRLRTLFPSRWVRFHSLPDRKRYPRGEAEQAEVLRRHHAVLQALTAQAEPLTAQLVAITCSWSASEEPVPRYSMVADAMPEASSWRSHDRATEPGFHSWEHYYISATTLTSPGLDRLLAAVANDITDGVLLAAGDLSWLYHPFDGGADVIAGSVEARDQLAAAFAQRRYLSRPTSPSS